MNLAQKLGYPANQKLLMIHADDAGLSHAENSATMQVLQKGAVSSYSIMMPCPWLYEIVDFARKHPQFDYGIHLTLTCEWKKFKFGPLLSPSEVPSLVDKKGYFYKTNEEFKKRAVLEEVEKELRAQIESALALGLKPSHLDSHMYSLGTRPDLVQLYKKMGKAYGLPVFLSPQLLTLFGVNVEDCLEEEDFCTENVHLGQYTYFEQGKLQDYYDQVLDQLPEGFNLLIIHTAFDTPEMQAIAEDHPNFGARWRQIDFDYFSDPACKAKLAERNIQLINWRDIRSALGLSPMQILPTK